MDLRSLKTLEDSGWKKEIGGGGKEEGNGEEEEEDEEGELRACEISSCSISNPILLENEIYHLENNCWSLSILQFTTSIYQLCLVLGGR